MYDGTNCVVISILCAAADRLGYEIVRGLGHSMRDPLPSLFSFKVKVSSLYTISTLLIYLSAYFISRSIRTPRSMRFQGCLARAPR